MNYIAELKAFYDRLELNPQPNTAIALWHALMSIANKAMWPDMFTVAQSVLMLKSGLNESAFKRARNKLSTDGLIEWKTRGGNLSAQYRMISLVVQNQPQNEPQSEPQSEPQNDPQNGLQSDPQSEPINKHKHKRNNLTPISPLERFEFFWACYPLDKNKTAAERAYCSGVAEGIYTEDDFVEAAKNYAEFCRITGTEERYIKQAGNWLAEAAFEDYLPGKYKRPAPRAEKNKFNQFAQNSYDFEELERSLNGK